MLSMQYVQGDTGQTVPGKKIKIGWLGTRPNCRHRFVPITIEQAGGNIDNLLNSLHLKKGTYRDGKYQATQKLRYIERNIRNNKAQLYQAHKINNPELIKHYSKKVYENQETNKTNTTTNENTETQEINETEEYQPEYVTVNYNNEGIYQIDSY